MPKQYLRKAATGRGAWNEQDLKNAMEEVQNRGMSIIVPLLSTIYQEKHLKEGQTKQSTLKYLWDCHHPSIQTTKERLSKHVKGLQSKGFPLIVDDLIKIVSKYVEQLQI